jgi:hypothetical protein
VICKCQGLFGPEGRFVGSANLILPRKNGKLGRDRAQAGPSSRDDVKLTRPIGGFVGAGGLAVAIRSRGCRTSRRGESSVLALPTESACPFDDSCEAAEATLLVTINQRGSRVVGQHCSTKGCRGGFSIPHPSPLRSFLPLFYAFFSGLVPSSPSQAQAALSLTQNRNTIRS